VTNLATVTQGQLDQWNLLRDGEGIQGSGSMVLPVRTSDGGQAVLKVTLPDDESEHEHLALRRRWGGGGAVRLLSADPNQAGSSTGASCSAALWVPGERGYLGAQRIALEQRDPSVYAGVYDVGAIGG
jgi:hypothetical protein